MAADPPDAASAGDTSVPPQATSATDASELTGADEHFGFGQAGGTDAADGTGGGRRSRGAGPLSPGFNLGGVSLVRLIAEGGMGRVYEGRQAAPDRLVAVKVLRGGFASAMLVRRFEYEARVLARLRHHHIAQIFTFGTFDDGVGVVPFFVMEMVEGALPITRSAAGRGLGVRERVALFRRVCAAVAHGHQKGVIHRDLKPGNILVDAAGEPKVIDFGVARSIDPEAGEPTQMTRAGDVIGTVRYMSPKQLGVGDGDVDARSDVYALGLVLHEVLTGNMPYELRGASFLEAARVLGDPTPVSTVAVDRAARTAGVPAADARTLATIVATCLEKSQSHRYATAVELEAELGRWLAGDAILARPPTLAETMRRFARRHWAATAAAVAAVGALVAATAGVSFFYVRAERQRVVAEEARLVAEQREDEAGRQAAEARAQLYVSNVLLAAAARDRDNVVDAERLLRDARALVDDAGTTNPVELGCLAASLDESVAVAGGHGGIVTAVGFASDGTSIASGATDGLVRIGRCSGGRLTWNETPIGGHDGPVWATAFSADGRLLATTSADGGVRIWAVSGRELVATLTAHDGATYAAAFSPDGTLLATGGRDRVVRLWDCGTWSVRAELRGHEGTVFSASFTADGRTLATASVDRTVRLWDATTGTESGRLTGHEGRVFAVAFAPDGSALATAGEDAAARIWDVATGTSRLVLEHPFRVNGVAWVDGGRRLATASGDSVVRVWNAADGRLDERLLGHAALAWSIASAAPSGWVVTGGADGTVRLWDVDRHVGPVMPCDAKVLAVAYSPDGTAIATALANSTVRLWDARTLESGPVLRKAVGRVNDVRFTPDSTTVLGGCDDGSVQMWERSTGRRREWIKPHDRRVYAIDVSRDGRLVATASEDGTARVWSLAEQAPVGEPRRHGRRVLGVAIAPAGDLLATAGDDRTARLWRMPDGPEVARLEAHEGQVNWVAFSADGSMLVTACSDQAVRAWNVADGTLISVMTGPARQVWKAGFSPDGRRVAAVSADGTAQVWDVASGRALPMLRGHTDQVWGVAFAPDGRSLVTGSWDGTARLWGVSVAEIARRRLAAGGLSDSGHITP
ncbi:MAG: WD40 repeat domain-containing serine/threonine protein kinase [Planctomycetaceae bacterium]